MKGDQLIGLLVSEKFISCPKSKDFLDTKIELTQKLNKFLSSIL